MNAALYTKPHTLRAALERMKDPTRCDSAHTRALAEAIEIMVTLGIFGNCDRRDLDVDVTDYRGEDATPAPAATIGPAADEPVHRIITSHQVNPCNDALCIEVMDDPDDFGSSHVYHIIASTDKGERLLCEVTFQKGPIRENGVNGITQEALLAIVEDRLIGFQNGPFACAANDEALRHVQKAMHALHSRTRDRLNRGVEGTHKL